MSIIQAGYDKKQTVQRCRRRTLRESHDEYEVDRDETQEISHDHPVNHDHEGAHGLEPAAEEEEVGSSREHYNHGQHVLDLVRAHDPEHRKRQQYAAREQKHHPGRRGHLFSKNIKQKKETINPPYI